MASFNFLTNTKVYMVHGGFRYPVEVESISADQTLMENSYSGKTLHEQNMFEPSTISKANPANFEFTIHLIREDDYSVVFSRLLDYAEFDLYVESDVHVFRLSSCIITNGSISVQKNSILKLGITGQAKRLYAPEATNSYSYPGTLISRASTTTYNLSKILTFDWDSTDYSSHVESINIELQNQLEWTPYTTVNAGIEATDINSIMYPTDYTIKKRILAGNIRKYIEENAVSDVQNFNTSTPLRLTIGETIGGTNYGIDLNLSSVSWTNRTLFEQIYMEDYSWRMNYNPTLSTVFNYNTY